MQNSYSYYVRRTARLAFKLVVNLALFYYLTKHLLQEDNEEVVENKNGEAEGEDEVDVPEQMPEDAIFIPLWFPKEKPQHLYKGSDPEWQSAVTFSKDREKVKKVKRTSCALVGWDSRSILKSLQRTLSIRWFEKLIT